MGHPDGTCRGRRRVRPARISAERVNAKASEARGNTMVVRSVRVRNYRSISDAILPCDSLTALVGPNGAGKSNFLGALSVFYEPAADYSADDFHYGNKDEPIRITVTFGDLTDIMRSVRIGGMIARREMKVKHVWRVCGV